jgi:hypothetical protein
VTTFRSSRRAGAPARGEPQLLQKREPSGFSRPQLAHDTMQRV